MDIAAINAIGAIASLYPLETRMVWIAGARQYAQCYEYNHTFTIWMTNKSKMTFLYYFHRGDRLYYIYYLLSTTVSVALTQSIMLIVSPPRQHAQGYAT